MRKGMLSFFVILCSGALFAGGCAKKEMIKGEEPAPSATRPAETAPARTAGPGEAGTEQPVKAPMTVKAEPMQQQPQAQAEAALETIYFDFDSYTLSQSARDTLSKDAAQLQKATSKVRIEGHTDERGTDEYNLALGEKRAKASFDYLVTLGVPAARLSYISFGEEKPAEPGHDEAAWAKNRRVEFNIMK